MKVFKFHLSINPINEMFESHPIYNITRFDEQYGGPVFWALVDEHRPKIFYQVRTIETGDGLNNWQHSFYGTTMHHDGTYVLHHFIDKT